MYLLVTCYNKRFFLVCKQHSPFPRVPPFARLISSARSLAVFLDLFFPPFMVPDVPLPWYLLLTPSVLNSSAFSMLSCSPLERPFSLHSLSKRSSDVHMHARPCIYYFWLPLGGPGLPRMFAFLLPAIAFSGLAFGITTAAYTSPAVPVFLLRSSRHDRARPVGAGYPFFFPARHLSFSLPPGYLDLSLLLQRFLIPKSLNPLSRVPSWAAKRFQQAESLRAAFPI